ncbi:MAG: neutral/alkaline non-lysosomal ceramidase N-terminal domain-containing protein [Spirochaetota bacterium]
MNKRTILAAAIITALFLLAACGSARQVTVRVERKEPLKSEKNSSLLAGTAKTDITPPPGMPLAGYSSLGNRAAGFRHRLYARAIYLRGPGQEGVAVVQCDLLFGSRMLHHRVAELIAEDTDVDLTRLMIAGTHTHSGPGNYYASKFYNRFASCGSGFDPEFFDFLSRRMAQAVIQAYQGRKPAKMATGSVDIKGVSWNRSMPAYRKNFEEDDRQKISAEDAVNTTMHMVRIDCITPDGTYKPAGTLCSFSLHCTIIPPENRLYSGDVFGWAERQVEWSMSKTFGTKDPVCALVNATHADNSPLYNRKQRGFSEAKRLGVLIGTRAFALFERLGDSMTGDVKIRATAQEVDVYRDGGIEGITLCRRPVVGSSLTVGSTEDGATPVLKWLPLFREGWGSARWIFTGGCQGHKRYAGGPMQSLVVPRDDFPHVMFFQVMQLDSLYLLPMPFEVTCEAGRHIQKRCATVTNKSDAAFAVISCANGMFGYATTPGEYSAQHYEGGHTLYGPQTVPFLAAYAEKTLTSLDDEIIKMPRGWEFVQQEASFWPEPVTSRGDRKEQIPPRIVHLKDNRGDMVEFTWLDTAPANIRFHQPLVRVETSSDGVNWTTLEQQGVPVNDDCGDISVECLDDEMDKGMALYKTVWHNPQFTAGHMYRFVILPRDNFAELVSSILVPPDE